MKFTSEQQEYINARREVLKKSVLRITKQQLLLCFNLKSDTLTPNQNFSQQQSLSFPQNLDRINWECSKYFHNRYFDEK